MAAAKLATKMHLSAFWSFLSLSLRLLGGADKESSETCASLSDSLFSGSGRQYGVIGRRAASAKQDHRNQPKPSFASHPNGMSATNTYYCYYYCTILLRKRAKGMQPSAVPQSDLDLTRFSALRTLPRMFGTMERAHPPHG